MVRKGEVRYLTRYLTPPKKENRIQLRTHTIVGYMESGKTTMAKSLLARIIETIYKRGYENVLGLYSLNFADVIKYLDERNDMVMGSDYIYIIIDDAALFQMSREFGAVQNIYASKLFYYIRHIFEKYFEGTIIVNWLTQRLHALDVNLRESPLISFKSMVNDPNDKKLMYLLLGKKVVEKLSEIDYKIYVLHDDRSKKYSAVRLRSGPKGKPLKWIARIDMDLSFNFIEVEPEIDILQALDKNNVKKTYALIGYFLAQGYTFKEIKRMLHVSENTISRVSKWVKEVISLEVTQYV